MLRTQVNDLNLFAARSDLPRATWVQALICTVNRMKEQVKQMLSLSQSLQTARSQTRKVHRLHLCQASPGSAQEEMTGGAGISLSLEGRGWGLVILSGVTLTRAGPGEDHTGH